MQKALSRKITISYCWDLLGKWLNRGIGLISSLCLVRILSPEDFGIVALASIILAFFVMISDAGCAKYLIKTRILTEEKLNSAWSLNIILKTVCSLIILLMAKTITDYMNNAELYPVLIVLCLLPILSAFRNIGIVVLEKQLDFKPLTKLSVIAKVTVLPITLSLALTMKSYWALVIGLVMSELLTVVGSYFTHPYRPCWSTIGWRDQWSFSKWHLLSMTTGYIRSRIDAILLGRYVSSSAVGLYRVGQEFAWLPFTELIAPATRSMYSGFSQMLDDKQALHQAILRYLVLSYLLVVPSIAAIYQFTDLFTLVLLGKKWQQAAPVIGLLALLMLSMPLNICLQAVLTSFSKVKYLVLIDSIMISLIVSLILVLAKFDSLNLNDFLQYRVILVFLFILLLGLLYKILIKLALYKLMLPLIFPIIPSLIAIALAKMLEPYFSLPALFKLGLLTTIGGAAYFLLVISIILLSKNSFKEYKFIIVTLKKLISFVQNGKAQPREI